MRIKLLFFFAVCFCSCTRLEYDGPMLDNQSLKIDKAKALFAKEVEKISTRGSLSQISEIAFNAGDIFAEWESADVNRNQITGLENVETFIQTSLSYRVLQTSVSGERVHVPCYRKLLVTENKEGMTGVYVVWFIPTIEYAESHDEDFSKKFKNNGDMGDFSGVKVYAKLNGPIVRINKYNSGRKVAGIYFPKAKTKASRLKAKKFGDELLSGISILTSRFDTRYRLPGDDFEYDIEPAYCYGEEEGEDGEGEDGDDDEDGDGEPEDEDDDREDDPEEDCDPDDCGDDDGDDCEWVPDDTPETKQLFEGLNITGPSNALKRLEDILVGIVRNESSQADALIARIVETLGRSFTINLIDRNDDSYGSASTKVSGLTQTTCTSCVITYYLNDDPENDYFRPLYEEILHVYQYFEEGSSWKKGDKEFEAKVFDAVIEKDYHVYLGMGDDVLTPFYDYYKDPSEENFEKAVNRLRDPAYFGYTETDFPISNNIPDRLKHIHGL